MGLLSGKKQSLLGEDKNIVQMIPLSKIVPDEHQPRKRFTGIAELAESIKITKGIQTPLHVVQIEEKYRIITGERRYQAAQYLVNQNDEWSTLGESVPCIVHQREELDETAILRFQLIENLQREDLSAVEEARAYQRLVEQGMTQRKIAGEVGRSESFISGCLAMLKIPAEILAQIDALDPPLAKRELIKMAQEKEEKRDALLAEVLSKRRPKLGEEMTPIDQERTKPTGEFHSDEIWEWLKKLVRKDKDALLKLLSPAKLRQLKQMIEGEEERPKE